MKIKSTIALSAIMTMTMCFNSCHEADTTAPVINLSQPAQGDSIDAGDELCIQVTFTDDVALNSYKINIHPNFNGHQHLPSRSPQQDTTEDFEITLTSQLLGDTLTGKNCFRDIDIDIPANATLGKYHLLIYCTDLAGNEAYLARDIIVK